MAASFRRRIVNAALGALLLTGTVTGLTLTAGTAAAAPCSGTITGNGSSPLPLPDTGSLGSLGSGSLDAGALRPGSGPSQGPQRPLIPFRGAATSTVGWLTGPLSPNRTFSRFGVSGTDLGIAWDNGRGQTLLAFGDTFGDCRASGQQWRHNILFRTDDDDPGDGIRIPDARPGDANSGSVVAADAPRYARELIGSLGISDLEMTTIPTAAISVRLPDGRDRQYLNYMSVRSWGSAGHWLTNFSAVAYSDDNGQSWTVDPATVLINSPVSVALPAPLALPAGIRPLDANNGKFQQNAYFRGAGDDPYLYQLGTPNGRFGAAFLARFAPLSIRDLDAYQYWAGSERGWVDDIGAISDDGSAIVVPAPVTEASVSWSPYLGKYLALLTHLWVASAR